MTEETAKTKETMTINGVQHIVEDMTPEQQYMIRQLKDLQQKTESTRFALDQCQVAAKAFTAGLIKSLEPAEPEAPVETPTEALESIEAPLTGAAASAAFDAAKVN